MSRDERELKRITPFALHVVVRFVPDAKLRGYRLSASGEGRLGDKRIFITVAPWLNFTTAQKLHSLDFDITINANDIVPHVNKANKE